MGDDVLSAQRAPGALTTNSSTASPVFSSGTPMQAHSATPGQRRRHRFDLVRVDVEARDDDHVLLAVDDLQESAGVEHADVAGAEVAVRREGRGVRLGLIPVAAHHLRALDADFAGLALGTSLPVSSSSLMSVDGSGKPVVPVNSSMNAD